MTSQVSSFYRVLTPDGGDHCETPLYLSNSRQRYGHFPRAFIEQYMCKRFGGHVNIDSTDLSILEEDQLLTLFEVFRDLEHYELAIAMIRLAPSQWDQGSKTAWIRYVSNKYVDNHEKEIGRTNDDEQFQMILRRYWEKEHRKWCDAAEQHDRVIRLREARDKFKEMETIAQMICLTSINPSEWNYSDTEKFHRWIIGGPCGNNENLQIRVNNMQNQWQQAYDLLAYYNLIPTQVPSTPPQSPYDHNVLLVKTFSEPYGVTEIWSSTTPPSNDLPGNDFADPEDWDKETLNRWLECQLHKLHIPSDDLRLSERHRRLIMIYVRCAWPHDQNQYALKGLSKVFSQVDERLGLELYQSILKSRPTNERQETPTKTESQRHRNRRDLHLWEFLLILLANPEYETESIHWKYLPEGKFELSDRVRIAKMWGLTKGNNNMTYDNMSRSVRQYYKDDDTGIMIRHRPGEPSFGKYSYQFSMNNSEVEKLWKSLSITP